MIVPGNEGLSELPFQESRKVQEFQRERINSSSKTAGGFGVRIGMQANNNSAKLREVKKNLSDLFVRYPYHPCDWWLYLHENHKQSPQMYLNIPVSWMVWAMNLLILGFKNLLVTQVLPKPSLQ